MLALVCSTKLSFNAGLNQGFEESMSIFTEAFISKYSLESYNRADKIVIVEDKFYHVIKDKYGPPIIGEYLEDDSIDNLFNEYLTLHE